MNLAIMSIKHEIADKMDLDDIIKIFDNFESRKINF